MQMIHFIGDGILDNFYKLGDKKKDLRDEVSRLGFDVNNYAVDGAKMSSIIKGIEPRDELKKNRHYPYPIQKDGKMYPLKSLLNFKKLCGDKAKDDMVVISIGGIDIKSKMKYVLLGADKLVKEVATDDFKANYRSLLKEATENFNKVIIISVYLPYLGIGSSHGMYTPFSRPVIEKWNKFIKGMAKEFNVSIFDLSETLNPSDRSHYSDSDDTRISDKTSKCIAECLSNIFSSYQQNKVYSAPNLDSTKIIVKQN